MLAQLASRVNELSLNKPIEVLPSELLATIFEYITSIDDLKALCFVNKRFHDSAMKQLWYEPKLKMFTLQQFQWISQMPIHVLDISELTPSMRGSELSWYGMTGSIPTVDLFKLVGGMRQVSTLALDVNMIALHEELWSCYLTKCNIRSVLFYTKGFLHGQTTSLWHLLFFLKRHLAQFKYLQALTIDVEMDNFDIEEELLTSNILNLEELRLTLSEVDDYSNLFHVLKYYEDLYLLHLDIKMSMEEAYKTGLLSQIEDFMEHHPPAVTMGFEYDFETAYAGMLNHGQDKIGNDSRNSTDDRELL